MATQPYHYASELFDLGFVHGGPNRAVCRTCWHIVVLGEPEDLLAVFYATLHRIRCDQSAKYLT